MTYKKLKAGDVRQEGDETRREYWTGPIAPEWRVEDWRPVSLIGWEILPADLFTSHFHRPNG